MSTHDVNESPVVNIVGEHTALGPLRHDLLPLYYRWHNDFTIRRNMGRPVPWTLERAAALYERGAASETDVHFTVYHLPAYRPIGTSHLFDIDFLNRRAEFGIVLGDVADRGRGFGTEVTRLMLDYAFTALNLHNVILTTNAYNVAGIRAYEKAGFRECGRRRESRLMGGRMWDVIYMDCLTTEFTSPVLSRVFTADEPGYSSGS